MFKKLISVFLVLILTASPKLSIAEDCKTKVQDWILESELEAANPTTDPTLLSLSERMHAARNAEQQRMGYNYNAYESIKNQYIGGDKKLQKDYNSKLSRNHYSCRINCTQNMTVSECVAASSEPAYCNDIVASYLASDDYATQLCAQVSGAESTSHSTSTTETSEQPAAPAATVCPQPIPNQGIKEQRKDSDGNCYPTKCYEPCYRLRNRQCEHQTVEGGTFLVISNQCTLTCLSATGYVQDPRNQWKCTKDCTSSITDPHVKRAEYRGSINPNNLKCEITECKGNYHPSDDKQSCIADQGDCTPDQLTTIHASEGYLLTQQNKCVPKKCLTPQYKKEGSGDNATCVSQVGTTCNVKHATTATYQMRDGNLICVVTACDTSQGYKPSADGTKCIKDCLSTIQAAQPLATQAEYDNNMKCVIKKCAKKDGKKYIPSDDGQTCEETERDCDKTTDASIWPEHATAAGYKKSKTGGTPKCVATDCEPGYDLSGGKCGSVDDSDCDKKPDHASKSHRYYDASTGETLCLIDECKKGYKITNDLLSCIPESALSEEEAQKRMDELKENAQAMKDRENSMENKLLGAAGIGAVGIGGMNIMSALSEQSADRDAEQDMKAYLATFRCDYGQGRNIVGGEKGIQLPGAGELIQYTTEYKQLAANLKSDKEALGMMPGIESQVVFDSATTGLYDDVSIGIQKGAFTSLSRALLDENSADAAEWQKMKDDTANKLKTGLVVAGTGALATIAGNIAINHGKGDKSGDILNQFEKKKQPIPDITLERIPCSRVSGTTGTGYVPNCECAGNAYFDEHTRSCEQCVANSHVKADKTGCECNEGFHSDDHGNCIANIVQQKCSDFNFTTGEGVVPNCTCRDTNATFNRQTLKCDCNEGYSNPNGGNCLKTCEGLYGVNSTTAGQYNVPNCPCEYSGATFDTTRNGCYCPNGQTEGTENGQKKCVTPQTPGTPCNSITGTTGTGMVPACTCTDTNAEFILDNGQYKCKCKSGFRPNASGQCVSGSDPIFQGNFASDTTFDLGAHIISADKCNEITRAITTNNNYSNQISGQLYICATGNTDTSWFKNPPTPSTEAANREKNIQLSMDRATAMYDCIYGKMSTIFPSATVGTGKKVGKGWSECTPYRRNTKNAECRKVTVTIQTEPCPD